MQEHTQPAKAHTRTDIPLYTATAPGPSLQNGEAQPWPADITAHPLQPQKENSDPDENTGKPQREKEK